MENKWNFVSWKHKVNSSINNIFGGLKKMVNRIVELLRLEKTLKIMKSNHDLTIPP